MNETLIFFKNTTKGHIFISSSQIFSALFKQNLGHRNNFILDHRGKRFEQRTTDQMKTISCLVFLIWKISNIFYSRKWLWSPQFSRLPAPCLHFWIYKYQSYWAHFNAAKGVWGSELLYLLVRVKWDLIIT